MKKLSFFKNYGIAKVPRGSKLRIVYDFQRQILRNGGKIDKYSDLLATFQKNSLVPNKGIEQVFLDLLSRNNNEKNKNLFVLEKIVYSTINYDWIIPRKKIYHTGERISDKTFELPPKSKWKLSEDEYLTAVPKIDPGEGELLIRNKNYDYIATLNKKYIDIIRLIKNGYDPAMDSKSEIYNVNILMAIILGGSLIIATLIYAYSNSTLLN